MARESSSALPSFMVLLLCVLCLVTAVAVLHMIEQERRLQVRFTTDKAQAISRQMLEAQHALLDLISDDLRELAAAGPLQERSAPACGRYLRERLQTSGSFINLSVIGPDGGRQCSARGPSEPVSVADRGYFQHSLQQREFAVGEFQDARDARVSSVSFAYPMISATGAVDGVVVGDMSLAWWSERLAEFRLPERALALIADAGGRVVAHYPPDTAQLGQGLSRYGLATGAMVDLDQPTELVTGEDGVARIFAHARLYRTAGGGTMTLSVGIPAATTEADATRWLRFVSLFFSGLVWIILLVAWQTWWKSPRRSPFSDLAP